MVPKLGRCSRTWGAVSWMQDIGARAAKCACASTSTCSLLERMLTPSVPPPAGFLTDNMEFQGQMWAFLSDGIGIISGSMMGTTPLTVYIESAAGIEDGGRTGLTGGRGRSGWCLVMPAPAAPSPVHGTSISSCFAALSHCTHLNAPQRHLLCRR